MAKYNIDWKDPVSGEKGTFTNIEIPAPGIPDIEAYKQRLFNLPLDVTGYRVSNGGSSDSSTPGGGGSGNTTAGDIIGTHDVLLRKANGNEAVTRSQQELERLLDDGYKLVREDGTLADWKPFRGGKVIDSHPLNVVLGRGWMPGQQEAIAEGIASGELTVDPVIDLTKQFSSGAGKKLALAGAALLGLGWLSRKKGRR